MLVAVILGPTVEAALQEIEEIKQKVDAAEIRLDYFTEPARRQLEILKVKARLPLVFTFRKKSQGGHGDFSESERLKLFERALSVGPEFADIEADTDPVFVQRIAVLYPKITLIGSYHHFEKTPSDLPALLALMKQPFFSIYKMALHANSTLDLMRLMAFGREMSKKIPLCCISLGEYGQPSRVLGPIIGNVLNYTSLRDQFGSLCQFNIDTLHSLYRFSHLTQETKIYALLGDPIAASRGDIFHNEIFRNEGIHAVYVKFRLAAAELSDFFEMVPKLPFGGFSVTIPLKEAILPFLSKIDPIACAIGAVNTIKIQGKYTIGTNTDAPGALHALEMYGKVHGKKLAILGAGGSARAIAYEAVQRGADVSLFNRTPKRAENIATQFGCQAYALDALNSHPYDVLINTIPPHPEGVLPILTAAILPHTTVMDINRYPIEAPLLQAARSKGCRCIDSQAMFEQQARLQQIEWN